MKRRVFSADGIMHVYQRTISGFNLFYTMEDFLVFYTIVSIQARRVGICILGMCLMIDHVHMLVSSECLSIMSRFINSCTSLYVREFNACTGRQGPLFESPYGSAMKLDMKRIRSAIAYLFNNPVEKHLCSKAEQYKWNFLAHYGKHPSVRKADCSNRLRRSMSLVEETFRRKRYLNHALLNTMMKDLTSEEKKKLADHIISIYFPFDIKRTTDCYGSYEEMLIAINSNTGSEYEIIETEYCRSDKPYRDIISYLHKKGIKDMHSVICMDNENKLAMMQDIKAHTSASYTQIRKFLHIQPLKRQTKPTRQLSH
ncbi:MAG: transposase [Bacteroidales bacterium]|nr:transposase [Bacteroidales bacterium]